MRFKVSHKTTYRYSDPVIQSQHLLHLRPRALDRQRVHNFALDVTPNPEVLSTRTDAFGNFATIIALEDPHEEFIATAESLVETKPGTPDIARSKLAWDELTADLETLPAPEGLSIRQYACGSVLTLPTGPIRSFAARHFDKGRPVLDGAFAMVREIFETFTYDPTATDVSTPVAEVLEKRHGVCQDFSHLALACMRTLRIPSKYVSGYLLTHPPPGQEKLEGADASHAWISVWAPETGWVDFDPTNGLVVGEEHISVAHGRDFQDVSPVTGVLLGGGAHVIDVEVDVREA
jgi:transglutaminase-like putative cysteine protease